MMIVNFENRYFLSSSIEGLGGRNVKWEDRLFFLFRFGYVVGRGYFDLIIRWVFVVLFLGMFLFMVLWFLVCKIGY